jgi:2-polyprenyl-3-methyl-5-hydroxy-6-metoxy-1,4-benzoquinol methylase
LWEKKKNDRSFEAVSKMKLNSVETLLMNNPVRAYLQRFYEAPLLMKLGGQVEGLRVLEIGCGRGVGRVERCGAAVSIYSVACYHNVICWGCPA